MNVFTATYTNYGCGDFSRNALPTCCSGYGKKDPTGRTHIYKVARGVKETPIRRKTIEKTENSRTPPIIHAANEGEEEDYAVDIAPRNLQKMKVKAGQKFTKVHIRDKILRRLQDRGRRRNHGGQVQPAADTQGPHPPQRLPGGGQTQRSHAITRAGKAGKPLIP